MVDNFGELVDNSVCNFFIDLTLRKCKFYTVLCETLIKSLMPGSVTLDTTLFILIFTVVWHLRGEKMRKTNQKVILRKHKENLQNKAEYCEIAKKVHETRLKNLESELQQTQNIGETDQKGLKILSGLCIQESLFSPHEMGLLL